MTELEKMGELAKIASRKLAISNTEKKDRALREIKKALIEGKERILYANEKDMENAERSGLKQAFMDRLFLSSERLDGIAKGVAEVEALPDPVGEFISMSDRANGLTIGKKRVPLGVIGIIYESRPNVTVDAAVLCLKSGNACILRGGKEAINSNTAMVDIMRGALTKAGLEPDCICLVSNTSRESAREMMCLRDYIDVLIPRGGAGLIDTVVKNALIPVIETGKGNCHAFIDYSADLKMSVNIIENAKCSRPSVCNAIETLLIHQELAEEFLPMLLPVLKKHAVELRCDNRSLKILGSDAIPALESDWETEYDDNILAVKLVKDIDDAIGHITRYGTGHSEVIITSDYSRAQRFLNEVDAAAVYVNASTRFTDGGEFGLGAEIGISTQKMHARGPMGMRELTSYKYVIYGNGQVR